MKLINSYFSVLCITALVVLFLLVNTIRGKWQETENIIYDDVSSYYGYLPAQFIYKDLGVHKNTYEYEKDKYFFRLTPTVEGKVIFRETCGMAIMYAPFFATAHFTAVTFGFHPNGYNDPYLFFLLLSTVFYFFLGLIYLRKILLQLQYTEIETGIAILLLGCGTALSAYVTVLAPKAPIYLFSLITVFVFLTMRWQASQKRGLMLALGLIYGLTLLISLNYWVLILFLILYNVNSFRDLAAHLIPGKNFLLFAAAALIVFIPQFLYWYKVTYNLAIPAFAERSESFIAPGFFERLISSETLFLVFSPVYLLVLAGLVLPDEQQAGMRPPMLVVIPYIIVYSFLLLLMKADVYDAQGYLAGFTAILTFPLIRFIRVALSKSIAYKVGFGSFILVVILWNLVSTVF